MHLVRAILPACLICSCSANPVETPIGLICTGRNGAVVRLNLDLAAGEFQKEGFPKAPITQASGKTIILFRRSSPTLAVIASLDRKTLVYTAQAQDLTTHRLTRTDYQCARGPAFLVAE